MANVPHSPVDEIDQPQPKAGAAGTAKKPPPTCRRIGRPPVPPADPLAGPVVLDPAQIALDYEEALERLARIRRCILRRDELASQVRSLSAQLRSAKAKLKEAGWDLSNAITIERRQGQGGAT